MNNSTMDKRTYTLGLGVAPHSDITISGNRVIETNRITDDQYKRALIIGLSAMVELGEISWTSIEAGSLTKAADNT